MHRPRRSRGWARALRRTGPLVALALAALPAVPSAQAQPVGSTGTTATTSPPAATGPASAPPSGAELLARIQQLIVQDEERLRTLETRTRALAREFEAASARFKAVDEERAALRARVQAAAAETAANGAAPSEAEIAAVDAAWHDARDHFDFVIQRRQSADQQLEVVRRKIEKQQEALDFLTGVGAVPLATTAAGPASAPAPTGEAAGPAADAAPTQPERPEGFDRRVADAQQELARREAAMRAVERRVRIIQELVVLSQDDRSLVAAGLEAAARQRAHFEERAVLLEAQVADAVEEGASAATRRRLAERLDAARRHVAEATQYVQHDTALRASLDERVEALEGARERVAGRLAEAERSVESARRRVEFLQSPLAPHQMMRWILGAAPRILLTLAFLVGAWLLGRRLTRRIVNGLVGRGAYGSEEERLERVETLRRGIQSGVSVCVVLIAGLLVLPEFGLDVTVLLGGAAVLSLAFAFGAQNLVRDYFYGLVILFENQYRVGNVVRIGSIAGLVEDVTLRMTTLRDLEGVAHFIPHGQITSVSNLTHVWSRVVFDVGVAYREDVDRVMEVLMELARDMRNEPEFGPLILEDPEMLGVDAFTDSAVIIKFLVRTRPLKQWIVKRELLRRIKNRFDELGIEIPFPHRTVYHRDFADPLSVALEKDAAAWAEPTRREP